MKKIKYLLWLLIVWFWLLINQGFCRLMVVEWITLPLLDNFSSVSNYRYIFKDNVTAYRDYWTLQAYYNWFWYSLYYNQLTQYDISNQLVQDRSCNLSYSGIVFNSSLFSYNPFTWTCQSIWMNVAHYNKYYFSNYYTGWNQFVYLWVNNDFWKNFITIWWPDTYVFPRFAFWWGFFWLWDYFRLDSATLWSSPLRVFFNQNSNLSSPLDWFDLNSASWSNMVSWSIARQFFTEHWFTYQTKYNSQRKTFSDLWNSYQKIKHFWGYWMWYSFTINTLWTNQVRWDDYNFVSVGSRCVQNLMEIGMSDPYSWTSSWCQQLWLLVLKWESYTDRNNNASVVVLSKNPLNKFQILYEQFDCAEDDVSRLFDDNYCSSISHWYITINWTWNILPSSNIYTIWGWNSFLDLLLYWWYYWYTTIESNQYCLNSLEINWSSSKVCFSLQSTVQAPSIKSLFLQWWLPWVPSITNPEDITEQMIANCKWPFYNTPDWLPPSYCDTIWTNFTWNCYTDIWVDSSWNVYQTLICIDWEDYINNTNTWVMDWSWNYISYCSWDCNWNYIYYWELTHPFTTTWFFDTFFLSTWNFFKCPYNYTQKIIVWKKLINLINYDPFVPINCFIASYLAWKNNVLFNSWLQLIDWGPLFKSTSDMAVLLYHFFDFLLCIWFILFGSFLWRFFNR